jgi:hypothetical protein
MKFLSRISWHGLMKIQKKFSPWRRGHQISAIWTDGTKSGVGWLVGYPTQIKDHPMNRIIYLVGLVVIVIAILSFIGIA